MTSQLTSPAATTAPTAAADLTSVLTSANAIVALRRYAGELGGHAKGVPPSPVAQARFRGDAARALVDVFGETAVGRERDRSANQIAALNNVDAIPREALLAWATAWEAAS